MTNPACFLLGAGASYPYGVPLMAGFYAAFVDHIQRRHSHCSYLLRRLEAKRAAGQVDLESLMSDLQLVTGLSEGLSTLGVDPAALKNEIQAARELRGYLDAFIVDTCERFDRNRAVRDFATLLALRRLGQLWVFTTNYDRILELSCEEGSIAFSDGFDTAGTEAVSNWTGVFDQEVCVVKLHGSVNWYADESGGSIHRLDRGYALPTHEFRLVRRDHALKQLMVVPTLEKDALDNPYIQLATFFTDVLRNTRLLVVIGNSLRDRHIRSFIQARLNSARVLIVGPTAPGAREVLARPDRTHTLGMGASEFLTLGLSGFERLLDEMRSRPPDDRADAESIDSFVARATSEKADDDVMTSNLDIGQAWAETRADSAATRARALTKLRSHPHPAVSRRIGDMMRSDSSAAVRVAAITAATSLLGAEAVELLSHALLNDPSQEVQMEAALGLRAVASPEQASVLMRGALQRVDLASPARAILQEEVTPSPH